MSHTNSYLLPLPFSFQKRNHSSPRKHQQRKVADDRDDRTVAGSTSAIEMALSGGSCDFIEDYYVASTYRFDTSEELCPGFDVTIASEVIVDRDLPPFLIANNRQMYDGRSRPFPVGNYNPLGSSRFEHLALWDPEDKDATLVPLCDIDGYDIFEDGDVTTIEGRGALIVLLDGDEDGLADELEFDFNVPGVYYMEDGLLEIENNVIVHAQGDFTDLCTLMDQRDSEIRTSPHAECIERASLLDRLECKNDEDDRRGNFYWDSRTRDGNGQCRDKRPLNCGSKFSRRKCDRNVGCYWDEWEEEINTASFSLFSSLHTDPNVANVKQAAANNSGHASAKVSAWALVSAIMVWVFHV